MAFERIVGLFVTDKTEYQNYRKGMLPILERYGGQFTFDFEVSAVLKSPSNLPVNRLFTLQFPNESLMNDFFADEAYQSVREQYFEHSVSDITPISMHKVIEP
ncbi:DUF1330 domain-containing protein [Echinimonas agarilytica]|uniref:DUF1330 domain-containing protein n=1 Tax=Echinimonas agarilytica TaxID=1215918 RepID=A0AA41WC21_9GAMM|nr:DUF1330 domain-containing protein [Echinimonas agarilytica]MCM2681254.1 DUF1330 domain-containing protein [Echinimonas agarilytica]